MAALFNQYHQSALEVLYQKGPLTKYFVIAEEKTQVKREYLTSGFVAVLALYLIFGYGAELICNLIGFVYPAYASLKALETRKRDDDIRWLTYWVVFAVFSILEFFSDILLSWMPFYYLAKCVFLVWCCAPMSFNGSDFIYRTIIRPFFLQHQTKIQETVDNVSGKIGQLADAAATNLNKLE